MFWKVYFGFMFISISSFLGIGFERVWDIISFIFHCICLVGLFGFVWQRPIFSKMVWKVFPPVMLLWNFIYLFVIPMPDAVKRLSSNWSQTNIAISEFILLTPLIWALFCYGYKDNYIWRQEKNNQAKDPSKT